MYSLYAKDGSLLLELINFKLKPSFKERFTHCHNTLEISCVKSGYGKYTVDSMEYDIKEGDVCIFNNIEGHAINVADDEEMINMVIHFEPHFIWSHMGEMFDYAFLDVFFKRSKKFENRLDRKNNATAEIYNLLIQIENEFRDAIPGFELMVKVKLLNILTILIRNYSYVDNSNLRINTNTKSSFNGNTESSINENTKLSINANTKSSSNEEHLVVFSQTMRMVLNYIEKNYIEDISLEMLAEIAHMNSSYFSSVFKKYNGISPSKYISNKRIVRALEYLKNTDKSIIEIANLCGFNTIANFNKIFKNVTGVSPSQIKKNSFIY